MFIEIFILSQMMNGPSYGYLIKKNTVKNIGPYYKINNNQLYPKLNAMEKANYITKRISVQEGKPNRHIYEITDLGIEYFYKLLNTFPEEYAANQMEYLTRIGLFHIMDAEVKQELLNKRKKVLNLEYEHMDYITELNQREKYVPYSEEYFKFSRNSIIAELALIEELLQKIST